MTTLPCCDRSKKFVFPDLTTMHYGMVKYQDDIAEKPDMFVSKSVKNIFKMPAVNHTYARINSELSKMLKCA